VASLKITKANEGDCQEKLNKLSEEIEREVGPVCLESVKTIAEHLKEKAEELRSSNSKCVACSVEKEPDLDEALAKLGWPPKST
jgi:hypothetical protein